MNIKLEYDNLKIINYIYDNYEEDIDITSVSEILTSVKQHKQYVDLLYGKSFNDFLNQIRIYKACDLLTKQTYK